MCLFLYVCQCVYLSIYVFALSSLSSCLYGLFMRYLLSTYVIISHCLHCSGYVIMCVFVIMHFFSLRCMLYLVLSVRFLVYAFLSMSLFLCVCIFVFIYAYLSVCECIFLCQYVNAFLFLYCLALPLPLCSHSSPPSLFPLLW